MKHMKFLRLTAVLWLAVILIPALNAQTPEKTYAQYLIDQAIARHPAALVLTMHVTPPNSTDNVVMASNIGRMGKKADEDDLAVIKTGVPKLVGQSVSPPKGTGYVLPDGTIQIVGWDEMQSIIESLNALFVKAHPGFKFKYITGNTLAPQHSLIFDETAFAPIGMEFSSNLGSAYRALVHGDPFGIRIAHGSLNPKARLSPLAIIVNKSNPLESLTTGQIGHIFTVGGRGPDIVNWSQAGVRSDLGSREIHPYGLPESDYYPSEDLGFGVYMFRDKLGMNHNARNYQMLLNYADVVKRVSEDPQGIGITALNQVLPDVKVIGVVTGDYGKPARGTAEEIVAGKYPYDRYLYIYVRRLPGQPVDPFVKEYLRLVLSREGQEAIASEPHGYLPLNAIEVAMELSKLE